MILLLVYFVYSQTVNERVAECNPKIVCETVQQTLNLNLHFTLHSHLDAFWLQTYQQYMTGTGKDKDHKFACTHCLFNGLMDALKEFPHATYMVSEMCFFKPWYEQYSDKEFVKGLIKEGRLEIVNGGWVQNDQAGASYTDIILQMALGHLWIKETFNIIPSVGFNIDALGHSNAQSAINYLLGMRNQIIERVDVNDIFNRVKQHSLEFLWESPQGYKVLTHLRFRRHGPFLHHGSSFFQQKNSGDSFCMQAFNQLKDFEQILSFQKQGGLTENVFHYGGDDFQYFNTTNFESQQVIMDLYSHIRCRQVKPIWSTPTQYFRTLINQNPKIKKGDFFPYYEDGLYWTGYYISNPQFKQFVRFASLQLQTLHMYSAQTGITLPLDQLREEIALAQHHDGIGGTAKYFVHDDVQKRIQIALDVCRQKLNPTSIELIGQMQHQIIKKKIYDCAFNAKCLTDFVMKNRNKDTVFVLIYNHLHEHVKVFELDMPSKEAYIMSGKGARIDNQEIRCWKEECKIIFEATLQGYKDCQFMISFNCDKECAPVNTYELQLDLSDKIEQLEQQFQAGLPIEPLNAKEQLYEGVSMEIDREGIDYKFTFIHNKRKFSLSYYYYPNQKTQSYNFWQKRSFTAQAGKYIMLNDYSNGGLICVIDKLYKLQKDSWYKDIKLSCGKVYEIDIIFGRDGIEIITLMNSSGLQTGDYSIQFYFDDVKNYQFYTDSNGWFPILRENYKREDYDPVYNQTDTMNGNIYPIASYAMLHPNITVLTDRAQGALSLVNQTLEIVIEHYGGDDGQGVGESCTKKINHEFRHIILFNDPCPRCTQNELQFKNFNIRLTDQFTQGLFQKVEGDRNLRLEIWPLGNQFIVQAENLGSKTITLDPEMLENIIQREFEITGALLSGIEATSLNYQIGKYEIKTYNLKINLDDD